MLIKRRKERGREDEKVENNKGEKIKERNREGGLGKENIWERKKRSKLKEDEK